jgi:two-component system nitrogen regulation response regulator GlnG
LLLNIESHPRAERLADLLGVNRNTLRKKIRDLDIQVVRTSQ